jgi:UDP-2,4-diacetamido-2,4,6-trideoxy-beta-L-altropyranose hydrolase
VKNVAIRTDASIKIGTGHFMRCLTLAEEVVSRGARVRFISRDMPHHLQTLLSEKNVEYVGLPESASGLSRNDLAHSAWLGTSQETDAEQTKAVLSGTRWDYLIVDHYALDHRWESMLRDTTEKLVVIDDLADRRHDCDILLDQNLYEDMHHRYDNLLPSHCAQLTGPRYALLRPEFRELRDQVASVNERVKKVLIFFGGMDAANHTSKAIQAVAEAGIEQVEVNVVIGATHPELEAIKALCDSHGFACHIQTKRIASLMAEADISIGAGGTAIWERCAMGLPTIVICTADNQRAQIGCAGARTLVYLPQFSEETWSSDIATHLRALANNVVLRRTLSANGMLAVDGQGVRRVADKLDNGQLKMRLAVLTDSEDLYQWRNSPSIRAVSRQSAPIARERHQAWLESVLADKSKVLLIAMQESVPVGVVRFDIEDEVAEISIYNVPESGNAGKGHLVLNSAENWMKTHRPQVRRLRAQVLGDNQPSHRLFISAGYELESTTYLKKVASTNE